MTDKEMLKEIADGLESTFYPHEEARREWIGELNSYLRGLAGAKLFIAPETMRKLEAIRDENTPVT